MLRKLLGTRDDAWGKRRGKTHALLLVEFWVLERSQSFNLVQQR